MRTEPKQSSSGGSGVLRDDVSRRCPAPPLWHFRRGTGGRSLNLMSAPLSGNLVLLVRSQQKESQ